MSTNETFSKVAEIARRAHTIGAVAGIKADVFELIMYIDACRLVCPLDLDGLLAASDGDLGHDVFGIARHFDPVANRLENGFTPRYAIPQP